MKSKKSPEKAKLFNPKLFPMDLARVVCACLPLVFNIKKIYATDKAKEKLKGRALLVANHSCFRDPLIASCCFWYRRVFYLAAENVMKNRFVSALLKGVGCIKINRNICDIESIKKAVNTLKDGHILTVFPQGGIQGEEDINTIKSGVVFMAMQSKSPIVPCYIHSGKLTERICVVIGEPITFSFKNAFPSMKELDDFALLVLEKMQECKKIYENSRR